MQTRKLICLLGGVFTSGIGIVVTFYGLTRLGWRRHGTSPLDFSFLHLDWVFQPERPYWSAHIYNLLVMLTGLMLAGAGLVICAWPLRKRNHAEQGGGGQPATRPESK